MSNHIIYLDDEGTIRAESQAKTNDFDEFVRNLSPDKILYHEGKTFEENIPEKDKDIFPAVLKSFKKQWNSTTTFFTNSTLRNRSIEVVQEENTDLVISDTDALPVLEKPKRKPRTKKA